MSDAMPVPPGRLLATTRPAQPYPGLRPFEMQEWSIFFGRERMIDDVIEMLTRQRLVVVHGASGSGKSSLIRAGVLPRLARQHLRHGVPWRTAATRPSGGPLWNLATALAAIAAPDDDLARIETIRRSFDRPAARLQRIVTDDLGLGAQRLCILIDQFEELFRYAMEISRDESQLFIELLTGLLEDDRDGCVHAILTMRSEFLGECARHDGLAEAINRCQYLLPRMDRDALLRAIRRPAELYGGDVEEGLAQRLIAEAGSSQDELPLIQHALMLLWRETAGDADAPPRLGLGDYRGKDGGIARLLSDHAEAVMARAAPDTWRKSVVELMFRALTDINAEGQAVRRPQRFDRLLAVTGSDADTLRLVIEAFRAEGVSFLTPYPLAPIVDATVIDISHEALIRCWRRIADREDGWLQREFQDGLVWRSMLPQAESFERNRSDVLSPTVTAERSRWMEGRPGAWCERYGGGWDRVAALMQASEAAAARVQRRERWLLRVSWLLMLVMACAALGRGGTWALGKWQDWQRQELWRQAAATAAAGKPSGPVRDCADCPEMIVVPPGQFMMGSPDSDADAFEHEKPRHQVTIGAPFAIGRFEVTKAEYRAFVADTNTRGKGCYGLDSEKQKWGFNAERDWQDPGFPQTDRDPVVCVSWLDAQEYVAWLSRRTGERYLLANEAEWEYAARAGTTTRYAFGDELSEKDANFGKRNNGTTAVGSYPANTWGLHDMHGNVLEWAQDCYNVDYDGAPSKGAEWTAEGCAVRVVRGGSWYNNPGNLRSASRGGIDPDNRNSRLGFRVARTLTP